MTALVLLAAELALAIVTAPWLPPLVGAYLLATAVLVWVCREWRP